jgi:hypothetical protein
LLILLSLDENTITITLTKLSIFID